MNTASEPITHERAMNAEITTNPEPQAQPAPSEDLSKYKFTVSPFAARKIYESLRKRGTPDAALRVGVRGGGCSGFTYVLEFDDKPPRSRDLVFTYQVEHKEGDANDAHDVRVLCDKKSILYLGGSTLDWERKLMYTGFKFVNPQETSTCGCNESFAV
jgi:iron-sulfur cluster assembly protein